MPTKPTSATLKVTKTTVPAKALATAGTRAAIRQRLGLDSIGKRSQPK